VTGSGHRRGEVRLGRDPGQDGLGPVVEKSEAAKSSRRELTSPRASAKRAPSVSWSRTARPAAANTIAQPVPMLPAPTIATGAPASGSSVSAVPFSAQRPCGRVCQRYRRRANLA
jgi:hypothetical protein